MRVVKVSDIIYVLENHLKTPQAAGIVLELMDYWFEIDTSEEGCRDCRHSWWNGESYECPMPICRFESKEISLEE